MRRDRDGRPAASTGRRLVWRVELAVFVAVAAGVRHLSLRSRLALGTALGSLWWAIDHRHRQRASRNVSMAIGRDLAPERIGPLVRRSMCHFARLAVETLALNGDRADIASAGIEHFRAARAQGRGLIGFTGHFGHWELSRWAAAKQGFPSLAIARPLENPLLETRLASLRHDETNRVIGRRGAVAAAIREVRAGGFVTVMADQRRARSGVPVVLFGLRAYATGTIATLALRTGAPLVAGFGYLDEKGRWCVTFEPEIPVERTGDHQADSARVMQCCTDVLERWIRRYPEQWLWTHATLEPLDSGTGQ
jgi:Kdo2-lipid IVA lauroyltransferase/acyltransferase